MRKENFFDASSFRQRKIKIGDKVRFLNSVGGGTVTAFRGKDQVLVEDEIGFDIPVLISECVIVGEDDRLLDDKEPQPYTPPVKAPVSQRDALTLRKDALTFQKETSIQKEAKAPKPTTVERFEETPQGERLNLSLAFLPVEPQDFMKTAFEAYVINESNYYLYINYMYCKNNGWISRFHGLIEPDTKIFLEEFPKSELNELEHICVQMIAFKNGKAFSLKNALSVELRLDTVKFYKLHCFVKNDFFDEDALIVPLIVHDVPERQMLISASDIQAAMYEREKDAPRVSSTTAVKKQKRTDDKIEVDLHINQLIETTAGMNNADMLNYQLSKFHEVMKSNLGKKGQKIVFIHGKGEGVLRTAMEKELKTTYKRQSRFQDASFREYGFGATMVTIF